MADGQEEEEEETVFFIRIVPGELFFPPSSTKSNETQVSLSLYFAFAFVAELMENRTLLFALSLGEFWLSAAKQNLF